MQDKKHLLIVDDELLIRDLLYDFFQECEYDISVADNGQSALDLLEESHFDTVIIDLKMPDMDGIELADRIRAQDEDLPLIFMTGFPSMESAIEALRRHAQDYFIKPFNLKHMRRSVEAAIARATADQQEGDRGAEA
jgi:DNA-binding NtrC family response regulator